jgi:hypothetical protein
MLFVRRVDGGTKLFIIDPLGVDVIDKNEPANRVFPVPLIQRLPKGIVGASRRLLTSTFNQDDVEHTKVMKFFT